MKKKKKTKPTTAYPKKNKHIMTGERGESRGGEEEEVGKKESREKEEKSDNGGLS